MGVRACLETKSNLCFLVSPLSGAFLKLATPHLRLPLLHGLSGTPLLFDTNTFQPTPALLKIVNWHAVKYVNAT